METCLPTKGLVPSRAIKQVNFCSLFIKITVMEIEKALINDRLRVSKVS